MRELLLVCGLVVSLPFWVSCADGASCSSDEVLSDGLCHPVPQPGAEETASGGEAGAATSQPEMAGAGGAS